MKKSVFCLIISIIFSNSIFSQEDLINKSEIEKLIASHLYDSVIIKGRVIAPIYSDGDLDITPLDSAIIDIYYLNTFHKLSTYRNSDNKIIQSQKTDKEGCFEFKLARGRYVFDIFYDYLDTNTKFIYLKIGDKEVDKKEVNLNDIRLEAYTICVTYD